VVLTFVVVTPYLARETLFVDWSKIRDAIPRLSWNDEMTGALL
jgi:hypothetical protein